MKGYLWGLASVVLATLAQLLMKWGMMQLPVLSLSEAYIWGLLSHILPLSAVVSGLFGYVVSMLCWFFTLRHLPLNKAYPLMSISYVLVYLATILLPWFDEPATILKTLAIGLILLGIWLINSQPKSS